MDNRLGTMIRRYAMALMVAAVGLVAVPGAADPITLVSGTINMFQDMRGINDVGVAAGDRMQYGASIVGGSAGVTLGATYPPTGFTDAQLPCEPLAVNPNFCANSTGFNLSRIAQPWTFKFVSGADSLSVSGPSMVGIDTFVPFPTNVTISNGVTPTTPTISWTLPFGFTPDGFRVQIFDKTHILANGTADIIYSTAVANSATSFTIPADLGGGRTLTLGGNYSINFQVIDTRGHVAFTGNNAQILSRSNSFFSFSPLDNSAPPNVHLPQVGVDANPNDNFGPVYQFQFEIVNADSVTFIDPKLAIGYDYATGAGDPNFKSVLLPHAGDDIFSLSFAIGGGIETDILHAGDQFFFPAGGVSAFSVRGIELSAGLDPTDATAFITGLTFVSTGNFTGTMTPVTQNVPESTILALLAVGFAGLGFSRRKRTR